MRTFATPGPTSLRIALGGGEVSVVAADEPAVSVAAVALRNDDVTREALEHLRVEHLERAGRHEVVVEIPKKRRGLLGIGRGPAIGLRVRCPYGSDLELSTSSADVDARGPLGAVVAATASGDLLVESVERCDLTSASGDAVVRSSGGSVRLKTASGDGTIGVAAGPISANLVSGDLIVQEARGEVDVNSVSGDVRIAAAAASVRVKSVSGDVEIGMVEGLKLWIDASSVSGTMSSDLEVGQDKHPAEGAIVEVQARTVSGDVHISRAAVSVS